MDNDFDERLYVQSVGTYFHIPGDALTDLKSPGESRLHF